jgi:acyl-CoA thioester hydrolase
LVLDDQLRETLRGHPGDSTPVEGFRFSTEIVVRFAETDAQGVAHNAAYLVWFEVARIDYLARFREGYRSIQAEGYEALTTEAHVRYLRPVFFDDRLEIHARCGDVRGARFRYEYVVARGEETVADGWTQHAVVDRLSLRPTRFPAWLADAIAGAES